MCDPVSMLVGAVAGSVGGKLLGGGGGGSSSAGNAEAERQQAEADAAASANRKLAADQKRRREQQSLIAQGAPSVGDQAGTGDSPLTTAQKIMRRPGGAFNSAPDISQSLIARGASQLNPLTPAAPGQPNRRKTIGGY
jgi:hypothetical protein